MWRLCYKFPKISTSEIFFIAWGQLTENTLCYDVRQTVEAIFFNYKGTFGIILLTVVEANYIFRCAHVGMQG
jgi:hypothetical protein